MKSVELFEGLSKNEKRTIFGAVIAVLLLILFVNIYDFSSFTSDEHQIGRIEEINNNARIKTNKRVLWQSAKKRQGIHVGDKIFTGKASNATIQLSKGSGFTLGENSLVEFQMLNKQKLANFQNGTYRIFSNGKLKVAMNGKVAEIDAQDSEFEIVVSGTNNIQIKTIKGSGEIKIDNKVTKLDTTTAQQPIQLDKFQAPKQAVVRVDIPPFTTTYNPTLYDEYVQEDGRLQRRQANALSVRHSVKLPIPSTGLSTAIIVQHSSHMDFSASYEHKTFGFDKKISKVFLGTNYWRYQLADDTWSDTYTFDVERSFPPHSKPELVGKTTTHYLLNNTSTASFEISSPYSAIGYVTEVSRSPDFSGKTLLKWQKNKTLDMSMGSAGTYYLRTRSVDQDYKLSEWSDTQSWEVINPPLLEPLQLAVNQKNIHIGENFQARWKSQDFVNQFEFQVKRNGQNVFSSNLKSKATKWFPKQPGTYQISVVGEDDFGRKIHSNIEDVLVSEPIVLTKVEEEIEEPVTREISSTTPPQLMESEDAPLDITTTLDAPLKARNRYYSHSYLTVGTSHFSMNSKAFLQTLGSSELSSSLALAVDYLYWLNNHGFQVMAQKSVVPLSTGVQQSDVMIAEARYRYRFLPYHSTPNAVRSFQMSGFLGYELFQNSKNTFFISSYSLMKAGLTVDVPIYYKYSLSAFAGYGLQSKGTKMELGGDLFYYVRDHFSFGLGYKINFVEFDLAEEFPTFSPYREAYAQGTFSLRYLF